MIPDLEREYPLRETETLEHLLDVCQDASLGARLAAEIFTYNNELATFFEEDPAEPDRFGTRLAILLSREGPAEDLGTTRTFEGALFHWRPQLNRPELPRTGSALVGIRRSATPSRTAASVQPTLPMQSQPAVAKTDSALQPSSCLLL